MRTVRVRPWLVLALATMAALACTASAGAASMTFFALPRSLNYADEITPGSDGALWFRQSLLRPASVAPTIGRITTAGVATAISLPAATKTLGLTRGPDGAIWYSGTNGEQPRLGRVTAAGVQERGLPGDGLAAYGLTTGPDRALWTVIDNNVIQRIAADGAVTAFNLPREVGAQRIISGPDGALWFNDIGSIGRISTTGDVRSFKLPRELNVFGAAFGGDGALWFTSSISNARIVRMSRGGRFRSYSIEGADPGAITAGSDGALWFANAPEGLGRITTSGEITLLEVPDARDQAARYVEGVTSGPDGALWFTIQDNVFGGATDRGPVRSEVGRLAIGPGVTPVLVARLADGKRRGRRGQTLRIAFDASRRTTGVLRLYRGKRTVARRSVRAKAGANSAVLRLPRRPGSYRLALRLGTDAESASDSARLTITR